MDTKDMYSSRLTFDDKFLRKDIKLSQYNDELHNSTYSIGRDADAEDDYSDDNENPNYQNMFDDNPDNYLVGFQGGSTLQSNNGHFIARTKKLIELTDKIYPVMSFILLELYHCSQNIRFKNELEEFKKTLLPIFYEYITIVVLSPPENVDTCFKFITKLLKLYTIFAGKFKIFVSKILNFVNDPNKDEIIYLNLQDDPIVLNKEFINLANHIISKNKYYVDNGSNKNYINNNYENCTCYSKIYKLLNTIILRENDFKNIISENYYVEKNLAANMLVIFQEFKKTLLEMKLLLDFNYIL